MRKRLQPNEERKEVQPAIPANIQFELPLRTRSDAVDCRITNLDRNGKRDCRLTISRLIMSKAGFKPGQRFTVLRGKAPHHRWIRVEPANYGQRLSDKGSLSLSVRQIMRHDVKLKAEKVEPLLGKDAVYFELPENWVIRA
jgi:hypothetical protein